MSELCGLRWSEIDWEKKWFWVHSPKTEHHHGRDKRLVPLFPELEHRFQELYDTLPEGCDDLILSPASDVSPVISPKKSLASWIQKVATRAGVKLWGKPFQNCRSSRDTELRKIFPQHWVNYWIGHTQKVAEDHYTQILPSDFTDAYRFYVQMSGQQQVQESAHEHAGIGRSGVETGKTDCAASPCISATCNDSQRKAEGAEMPPIGWVRLPFFFATL